MTRLILRLARFVGCLIVAITDEIDRATTTYTVEVRCPDVIPDALLSKR